MRPFGRPYYDVSGLTLDLCRFPVIQARIVEMGIIKIETVPRCIALKPNAQIPINFRQALEATSIAANVRQQNDSLQHTRSRRSRVHIPVNISVTDGWKVGVDRRPKNTSVNIDHEAWSSEELREDLVKIRALPDVPQGCA